MLLNKTITGAARRSNKSATDTASTRFPLVAVRLGSEASQPLPRRRAPRVPMEAASSSSAPPAAGAEAGRRPPEELKLRRKTLETVLEQCQRALEMMREENGLEDPDDSAGVEVGEVGGDRCDDEGAQPPPPSDVDYETDEVRRRSRRACFQFVACALNWESGLWYLLFD
jgi:hypothetical protein